ncbi:hypothetical protein TNCV_2312591 [Trichonephila clavipes]|nr:hypothetical protein TNCV_2312591 [Trichonephila clavipes]
MSHNVIFRIPLAWRVIGRLEPANTTVSRTRCRSRQKCCCKAVESIPRNRKMLDVDQGAGRPRATTSTDDRYIQLTTRRNRTDNATEAAKTVALGHRTKGVQPNSTYRLHEGGSMHVGQ